MSAVLFISSFLMYSRFLPFCPEPVTLAFFIPCPPFPGLCRVLAVVALPSLFALGDAFPAFKSQPKHCSLGEPFLTIPPISPPHSCLSESYYSSHSSSCLLQNILHNCDFTFAHDIIPFIPFLSDCRLCERRKHICLCSPLYPPGLVQVTNRSLSMHLWDR